MSSRKQGRFDCVFQRGRRVSGKWVKIWLLDENERVNQPGGSMSGGVDGPSGSVVEGGNPSGEWMERGASMKRGEKNLAVLVRRKAGNAVARNTVRRRIRAIYAKIAGSHQRSWRVVISVKDEACTIPYSELYHDMENLFGKVAFSHWKDSRDSHY